MRSLNILKLLDTPPQKCYSFSMSEEKKKPYGEELEHTRKFLDVHIQAVQSVIQFVINRTELNDEEVEKSRDRANDTINELSANSQYLGELMLSISFCYEATLRAVMGLVQEKITPASEMSLDDIATETFQSIARSNTKPN
jgi:hypothetical protein